MSIDHELNDWRAAWQAQEEVAPSGSAEVRRAALKQQLRLRTAHILELLTGVILLVSSAAVAWRVRSVEMFLWAAVIWLATLVASAFSIWNWDILWKHDLKSVAEFSLVYEKRCLAKVNAARFGKGLVVVQTLIPGLWLSWDYSRSEFSTVRFEVSMLFLIVFSAGFWIFFSRYRRSALQELRELEAARETH
jgi:hypothetical protein